MIRSHVRGGELFKIYIVNFFLTILTLGIYRFWAKTRLREYLWGHVEVQGDRLEYTGTGKELFFGFLMILFLILLPLVLIIGGLQVAFADDPEALQTIDMVQGPVIVFLVGVAYFRARRYRLTRTHWRGIYGNQTGSAVMYSLMWIGCYFLLGVSLGLAWPLCSVWVKKYEMRHTWVGNSQPEFEPRLSKLYGPFLIAWVGGIAMIVAIFTSFAYLSGFVEGVGPSPDPETMFMIIPLIYLGMIPVMAVFLWYRGKAYNHFISSTRFMGHDLTSTMSGAGYAWLMLSNLFLVILTLGLGTPLAMKRYLAYVERNVQLSGDGDFSMLMQGAHGKPSTGEGLADAFDVGAI